MSGVGQRARELLAAEFDRDEITAAAGRRLRHDNETAVEAAALRVIVAALASQPHAAASALPPLPIAFFDEFGRGADDRVQDYARAAVSACLLVEVSPDFTDTARGALAWVLWHHQGGSSPVGQPLRFALGMGDYDPMSESQIAEAKRYAAWAGATTEAFHRTRAQVSPPILAKDHGGMRVSYSGLLRQVRGALTRADAAPDLAEMLRQLERHMEELGKRWYSGDMLVVDELLQLYCIEPVAREALKAAAPAPAPEGRSHG
ncbi:MULTISPECIES: hypothetical protein [unclassified Xanthomonas]|uniref:hypothetical protein n=1 Tax=unclassified Xanthomonas TaxID=2643310 RepID=UPI002A815FED|nr:MULTISPECIES: hypothetical protein [unclassified Xanthomonas]MDY4296789.1 hypothetical protein [Xanthomonas sp. LF02-5]MDY4358452.1 hypothetical protein [Xanthomonas sp. LF04-12]